MLFLPIYDENEHSYHHFINYTIIAVCAAVFLYKLTLTDKEITAFFLNWGYVPENPFFHVKSITALFISHHPALLCLNIFFLWVFGDNVEFAMGHVRYVLFIIICGVAGQFVEALVTGFSFPFYVGLSGAVFGVMGAYFAYFPKAQIEALYFLSPFHYGRTTLEAREALVIFFIYNLILAFIILPIGGVYMAVWSNIGGAVAGYILSYLLKDRNVVLIDRQFVINNDSMKRWRLKSKRKSKRQ